MAGASGSGKPLVIKAKNKEELMKQLESLVGDKGKKALMGHIGHLVCDKGKVVQCQLPKNIDKEPTHPLSNLEDPAKAEDKLETSLTMSSGNKGSKRTFLKVKTKEDLMKQLQSLVSDKGKKALMGHIEHLVCDKGKVVQCHLPKKSDNEPIPLSISMHNKNDPIQDHNVPEKEEMPKTFSYSLFVTAKDCNKITFEEFMSAAHEFGTNAVEASGDDLRGYLSHLNFLCKMAATGKYVQQVHLDYDKVIRLRAQEIGWTALKADNTTVANLYYGFEYGISKENDEDLREPDLELSCSDGHQSDVETACSTSNPKVHQSMEVSLCNNAVMNKPHWQSVTTISTDPAILQYIMEDNGIAQVTQDKDNMHLPQSLEMTLVTETMGAKSTVRNKPQWQSVTTVSTDPAILQYRKEDKDIAQGTQDNDRLLQCLEMTLVTEAKSTMMPDNKRTGPTLGSKKAIDSTTEVIKDGAPDHSTMTTTLPNASVSPKRIPKRHMCSYCAKRFICPSELKNHLRTHREETYHICAYCSKIYTSDEVLRQHLHKHTVEPRVAKPRAKGNICSNCGKQFESYSELTIHMRHHTGEPDPCIQCGMKFISSEKLYEHMISHTEKKKHICSYCGKQFLRSSALTIHTRNHTREKPHLCSYCGKRFSSTTVLKSHTRCHTGEKPHTCSECGKAFSIYGKLKRHMVVHTGKRPYRCQYCPWRFKQQYHLKAHIKSCHTGKERSKWNYTIPSNEGKPHTCSDCGKQFKYFSSLKVHMLTHTGGDPLTCPECGERSSSTLSLRYHMMIHTQERLYECSHCDKGFPTSGMLDVHTRIHTGEKPYICSHCGKAFSAHGNLQRHKKIHTGEARPFLCSYCGKAFTQKAGLQVHIMIHTGEKPFLCSERGKGFSTAAYLRKHVKVHGEKTAQKSINENPVAEPH